MRNKDKDLSVPSFKGIIGGNQKNNEWKINPSQKREEATGKYLTMFCGALLIFIALSITFFIASKGLQTFFRDGVPISGFLTSSNWSPEGDHPSFGALNFIIGSFLVTLISALIAAPLGIGAAVFMVEIAPSWGQKLLQPVIELLVGIPSVVYGFVGLSLIVPFIRDNVGGLGFSLLAGSLVLSVMILPTITTLATDTLRTVPNQMKEGAYALGATRWQTIYRVILPTVLPGLLTAVILGMARAFGEALAVQMVIGNSKVLPQSLLDTASTLTSGITLSMGNTVAGSTYNNALWSMALILLTMSFLFIIVVRILGKRKIY